MTDDELLARLGAPYEINQEVRETSSSFLDFVERCARVYGDEKPESFDAIMEKMRRPSRFGENKINELYTEELPCQPLTDSTTTTEQP
jgi:hypothetical protein